MTGAFGIAASLLSLGAIDFGLIVASSVVMIENCVRHLAEPAQGRSRLQIIRDAAVEVRKPTMFGELIIMIVNLPILTLEGIEGKLFRPMALTVIFALVGSMILSLTLMPVLASLMLPKKIEHREPWLMCVAHAIHYPILQFAMHHKAAVLGFAGMDDRGLEGVELRYEQYLRGEKRAVVLQRDALGRAVFPKGLNEEGAAAGHSLTLTVDEVIQYIAEKELDEAVSRSNAKSGTIIVMDPKTGAVLALSLIHI